MSDRLGTKNAPGSWRAYVKVGNGPEWDEADPANEDAIIEEVKRIHAPIWDRLPDGIIADSNFDYRIGGSRGPDAAAFIGEHKTGRPMRAIVQSSRLRGARSRRGQRVRDGVVAALWTGDDAALKAPMPPRAPHGEDDDADVGRLLRRVLERLSGLERRFEDRDQEVKAAVKRITSVTSREAPPEPELIALAARKIIEAMLFKVRQRCGLNIPTGPTIETLLSGLPREAIPPKILARIRLVRDLTNPYLHQPFEDRGDHSQSGDDDVFSILTAVMIVTEWFVTSGGD